MAPSIRRQIIDAVVDKLKTMDPDNGYSLEYLSVQRRRFDPTTRANANRVIVVLYNETKEGPFEAGGVLPTVLITIELLVLCYLFEPPGNELEWDQYIDEVYTDIERCLTDAGNGEWETWGGLAEDTSVIRIEEPEPQEGENVLAVTASIRYRHSYGDPRVFG